MRPGPVPGGDLHFIMLDAVGTPGGWRVWCLYHGSLGAYLSPVQAFLIGMRHDQECGL